MTQSKREIFTPGPGVMEVIEEFMRDEQYPTKSGAINRIIINFGKAYKRSKQAQENQALHGSHGGYARAEIVCALMLFGILLMVATAFCASL